jgi:hypothetical protein
VGAILASADGLSSLGHGVFTTTATHPPKAVRNDQFVLSRPAMSTGQAARK